MVMSILYLVKPVPLHAACGPTLVYNFWPLTFPQKDNNQRTQIYFQRNTILFVGMRKMWMSSAPLVSWLSEQSTGQIFALTHLHQVLLGTAQLAQPYCAVALSVPPSKSPETCIHCTYDCPQNLTNQIRCGYRRGCYSSRCNSDGKGSILIAVPSAYFWVRVWQKPTSPPDAGVFQTFLNLKLVYYS